MLLALLLVRSVPAPAEAKEAGLTKALVAEDPLVSSSDDEDEDDEDEDGEEGAQTVASADEDDEDEEQIVVNPATGTGATLTASSMLRGSGALSGWFDLRPSWSDSSRRFHSENEAALEYRFKEDRAVGYTQEFRSNLLKGGVDSDRDGFEFELGDGYLWGDVSNILANDLETLTLSWEPRLYLPTMRSGRDSGMVFSTRQYLKLNWDVQEHFALFLWDAPIGYVYSAAGYDGDDGLTANRAFENRIELGARLSLFQDRLTLRLPVILQSVRHRKFVAEATNHDAWTHSVWIHPEIMVQVAAKTSVGLAYYSDSLADEQLAKADLSSGLKRGVIQLVLQQSI